jgi:transposase-like protein
VKKPRPRVTAAEAAEMVQRYTTGGEAMEVIAHTTGRVPSTVKRILVREGVTLRPTRPSPEEREAMARLYAETDLPQEEVGRRFGYGVVAVRKAMCEHGVPPRTLLSDEERRTIVELHQEGATGDYPRAARDGAPLRGRHAVQEGRLGRRSPSGDRA